MTRNYFFPFKRILLPFLVYFNLFQQKLGCA